jgi:hypothetical protein
MFCAISAMQRAPFVSTNDQQRVVLLNRDARQRELSVGSSHRLSKSTDGSIASVPARRGSISRRVDMVGPFLLGSGVCLIALRW